MSDRSESPETDRPPFLGTWGRVYAFVIATTLLVYALLLLFSLATR